MSDTPDSSIAGPSQQNPDEPSREYKPISSLDNVSSLQKPPEESARSFSVQLKPARALKQAIQALRDSKITVALIQVDEKGFKINVGKEDEGSTSDSSLSLAASALINFQCRRPTTDPLGLNLMATSWCLRHVQDDDTLTVYQVAGTSKLSIMCESSLPRSGLSFNFPSFNPNPPEDNIRSFSFQLRRAGILKRAIHILCDSGVNELGLAYIHVDDKGFQITVDNNDGCIAVFFLPATMLRNFQCSKPSIVAQYVHLAEVSWNLAPVDDSDTVTVYQVDGSNQLSFVFACGSAQGSVAMLSTNVYNFPGNIRKLPQIISYCEGRELSLELSCSFHKYSKENVGGCPVVAVEIQHNNVKFNPIDAGNWKADFRKFMEVEKGKVRGRRYRAWFKCNFTKALMKACELVDVRDGVQVHISSVPTGNVVFHFNPIQAGHLLIMKKTLAIYPAADIIERLRL